MASALRVVIQQQAAGPCASCLLNQSGDGGARAPHVTGQLSEASVILRNRRARPKLTSAATLPELPVALARQLISRTTTRPRRPYKSSPPPTSSKQSIVSTLHAHHYAPSPSSAPTTLISQLSHQTQNSFKMTGGKSGGKASGSKSSAQS